MLCAGRKWLVFLSALVFVGGLPPGSMLFSVGFVVDGRVADGDAREAVDGYGVGMVDGAEDAGRVDLEGHKPLQLLSQRA